jgi:hypothetical protein
MAKKHSGKTRAALPTKTGLPLPELDQAKSRGKSYPVSFTGFRSSDRFPYANYHESRKANCIWRGVPSCVVSLPKLEDARMFPHPVPYELAPQVGSNRTELVKL